MITEIRTAAGDDRGFFDCFDGYGVLRDRWDDGMLRRVADGFPASQSPMWTEVCNKNERRVLLSDRRIWDPVTDEFADLLASDEFVEDLSELTGIDGLRCDKRVTLQLLDNDDYVGLHTSPSFYEGKWHRVRLQVFLSGAADSWGGDLMLYKNPEPFPLSGTDLPSVGTRLLSVAPEFNNTVVFKTGADIFHGQPRRVWGSKPCKSVIANYYTKEAPENAVTTYNKRWWRT